MQGSQEEVHTNKDAFNDKTKLYDSSYWRNNKTKKQRT